MLQKSMYHSNTFLQREFVWYTYIFHKNYLFAFFGSLSFVMIHGVNSSYYVTGLAKRGLIHTIINIEKSCFVIIILITVYLENAWCLVYVILHQSVVIQGSSVGVRFNGLLAELRTILESFSPVPQVIT